MKEPDAIAQALRALFQRVGARPVGRRAGDAVRLAGRRGHRRRPRPSTRKAESSARGWWSRSSPSACCRHCPRGSSVPPARPWRSRAHEARMRCCAGWWRSGAARAASDRQPPHRRALCRVRVLPERAEGEDRLDPGSAGAAGGAGRASRTSRPSSAASSQDRQDAARRDRPRRQEGARDAGPDAEGREHARQSRRHAIRVPEAARRLEELHRAIATPTA